ncbi:MAG: hypothetical protein LQ338_008190 [Usnochroma carphineum]|nr:MAG: hypothetical protein LQ338_008190 [Usnochroma carphineum]
MLTDVEAQDLLIHKQVLKLKEGKTHESTRDADRENDQNEEGGSFLVELKEEFLGLSADTIRRVMVKELKGGRPPGQLRGEARVVEMINNGYIFSQQQMSLLCFRLLWMLDKDIHQGFKYGDEHRVWIEFAASGEVHSSPWFPDESRPDLRTFAFKIGHPKDTKAASLPLNPRIEGATKNKPTKLTNQALLVKQQALATEIVRVHKKMYEGQ